MKQDIFKTLENYALLFLPSHPAEDEEDENSSVQSHSLNKKIHLSLLRLKSKIFSLLGVLCSANRERARWISSHSIMQRVRFLLIPFFIWRCKFVLMINVGGKKIVSRF